MVGWGMIHHHMVNGMRIVNEAGDGQVFSSQAAAGFKAPFQDYGFQACLTKVRSNSQSIRASADNHYIIFICVCHCDIPLNS
jgi:hypothetical protein